MTSAKTPEPPTIWPAISTPDGEVEPMKDLYAHLHGVTYNVEAWAAALHLYKLSKTPPETVKRSDARQWGFIAAKECVMQLYHLRERLAMIKGSKIHPCKSISGHVDKGALKIATNLLDSNFRDIEDLRDAVAHSATVEGNPKHTEGPFGLVGFHEPDVFGAHYNGAIRRLSISEDSLAKICSVVTTFFHGFEGAAKELERLGHRP